MKYQIIPEDQIMNLQPVITNIQTEAAKEHKRNFTVSRSYYVSTAVHGGLALEKTFLEELSHHLSEYEFTLARASFGAIRAQIKKANFEKFKRFYEVPDSFTEADLDNLHKLYEKGNRTTVTKRTLTEKQEEKKKAVVEVMQQAFEKAEIRIQEHYKTREDFIPFLEREYLQCSAIVNTGEDQILCCGRPVPEKSSLAFCVECLRLYTSPAAHIRFASTLKWAQRQ